MRLLAQLPASHTIQGKPLGDAATAWLLPDSEDRRLQAWLSDGTETLVQGLLHSTTAPGHSTASGAANSQADMEVRPRCCDQSSQQDRRPNSQPSLTGISHRLLLIDYSPLLVGRSSCRPGTDRRHSWLGWWCSAPLQLRR